MVVEAESSAGVVSLESRADAQKDGPAAGEDVAARINIGTVGARVDDGVADGVADQLAREVRSKKMWEKDREKEKKERER